jgi:hypothetical protein
VTLFALDLDHDGRITTTSKDTGLGVLFDVDNDGYAEETNWIGPRDGILVLDRTADGIVADAVGVPQFNIDTTYLIAFPALFHCAGGLKGIKNRGENNCCWLALA